MSRNSYYKGTGILKGFPNSARHNRELKEMQRESNRRIRASIAERRRKDRESERQQAAEERRRNREEARSQRQQEAEYRSWAREQARKAREAEKLHKEMQFEAEVQSIIEENEEWTSVHKYLPEVISVQDINQAISEAQMEKNDLSVMGLFTDPMPEKSSYKQQVEDEANASFSTESIARLLESKQKELKQLKFEEEEPTEVAIGNELKAEAKSVIKAFWFWTRRRLVNEYVQTNLPKRFKDKHEAWEIAQKSFSKNVVELSNEIELIKKNLETEQERKEAFIQNRLDYLFFQDYDSWKVNREDFYINYIERLKGLLHGEQFAVEDTIVETINDCELPMEFFVESLYDDTTGLIRLEVDLPEIEDIPQRKIVLTATGKQSIRNKGIKETNEDYVQCVCGLAIYLAMSMFNVSPSIKSVEILGYTQRPDSKTNLIEDQYVYLINFDRDTFFKINCELFSALQVFSFFQHHILLTKSMELKSLDLSSAYGQMFQYIPVNYEQFILQYPERSTQANLKSTNDSASNSMSQQLFFDKSVVISTRFYDLVRFLHFKVDEMHNRYIFNVISSIPFRAFYSHHYGSLEYSDQIKFLCLADLFKVIKQLGLDPFSANDYLFVYSILYCNMSRCHCPSNSEMSEVLNETISFNKSYLKKADTFPEVPHEYYILELMHDYKDLQYYRDYLDLLKEYVVFIKVHSEDLNIKKAAKNYLSQLNGLIL